MRDDAKAVVGEEEHLALPAIRIQRPAMAEDYRRAGTPVLVIDLRSVFGGDGAHVELYEVEGVFGRVGGCESGLCLDGISGKVESERARPMPTYLTSEQEQRLQAVVRTGAYPSTEDALNAALSIVESRAIHGFEGSANELDELLLEGLSSGDPLDADDVWQRITVQTDQMLAEQQARPPRS